MLDLKKLAEKLDKALANETNESLTNWLQEKRLKAFLQSLGAGDFENIPQISNNNQITKGISTSFEVDYCYIPYNQNYLIAS
jgi:hypothetical protein